ncbi:2-oxoglutarate dehydrogenase E1 component [Gracilaria domingensis]|nr:2-oxoglutarate dehydrogenase E1 component [Gracilaria domingensis]
MLRVRQLALVRALASNSTFVRSLATKARSATPALSGTKLDPSESFMTGTNAVVLEEMYERYTNDPNSVNASWTTFFHNLELNVAPGQAVELTRVNRNRLDAVPVGMTPGKDLFQISQDTIQLMSMIRAYRHRGHLVADLDPLRVNFQTQRGDSPDPYKIHREKEPSHYGFTEADMEREFVVAGELPGPPVRRLRDIVNMLKRVYCGKIGAEYRHMLSKEQKFWIGNILENETEQTFSVEERKQILKDLAEAELFELFLARKHTTAKRFGLEGGEALIPGLQAMLDYGSQLGVENIVLGMAHRGRLNVLANVTGKPLEQMFHEFLPHEDPFADSYLGSGDVKYHLGTSSKRRMPSGNTLQFSLLANPSHLEAVDPVVVGKTRAKQFFTDDFTREKTMAVMVHGDASFAGQGVVAETLELSDLRDYTTGGTVHLVINNQIGFTTDPREARSSPYPTDVAKTVGIPIFHVNGDCPESVVKVCKLAMEYRQRFQKDVVIDLFCYRRHGHNELDQPMFTQPHMYKLIKDHDTPLVIYKNRLIQEGVITEEEYQELKDSINTHLSEKFEQGKDWKPSAKDWLSSHWKGMKSEADLSVAQPTGIDISTLRDIGLRHCEVPKGFKMHSILKKQFADRRKSIEMGDGILWATAEALAIGSLLLEGYAVRLSGQDCERGTFSQRHAVLHNQDDVGIYIPLNHMDMGDQARFQVCNSNLSEMAVLGFETGYSLESPMSLVMWEAQFGDFANGAQVIIDTFIAAGERKWRRQSGLTLLLPHGYEGQGPEHSSARLERFLQMCDDDPDVWPDMDAATSKQIQACNWQVVNPSTPANYFHVLRRQVSREFRKPLIIMTPKSLLRDNLCKSSLSDLAEGTFFERIIPEQSTNMVEPEKMRRVVFCSGKVYYDILKERNVRNIDDVAIVRVEQLSPFPFDLVKKEAQKYPNAELVWRQEESKNMGAWSYVQPRFATALRDIEDGISRGQITYVGRAPSAAPATGSLLTHQQEQSTLMQETFVF